MTAQTPQQLDATLAVKAAGLLKLDPLINLDPNDQDALLQLVEDAFQVGLDHQMEMNDASTIKMLALALNQWGGEFVVKDWAQEILSDKSQSSEERISDLYCYTAYKLVGSDAVDFSAYAILKFKRRYPDFGYDNRSIHIAAHMALKIATEHQIDDLLNAYSCVEIILFTGVDFMEDPICQPIKAIFTDAALSANVKLEKSFIWLSANLERIAAEQRS